MRTPYTTDYILGGSTTSNKLNGLDYTAVCRLGVTLGKCSLQAKQYFFVVTFTVKHHYYISENIKIIVISGEVQRVRSLVRLLHAIVSWQQPPPHCSKLLTTSTKMQCGYTY